AGAAGPDELVVHDVRGHPDQGEVTPPLPDDLLPGGHRDEVGEALQRDGVPVVHQLGDRIGQRQQPRPAAHRYDQPCSYSSAAPPPRAPQPRPVRPSPGCARTAPPRGSPSSTAPITRKTGGPRHTRRSATAVYPASADGQPVPGLRRSRQQDDHTAIISVQGY